MIGRFNKGHLVLTAETDEEAQRLAAWTPGYSEHAFHLRMQGARTLLLKDLGPKPDACRKPINALFNAPDGKVRLISNLAHTNFE